MVAFIAFLTIFAKLFTVQAAYTPLLWPQPVSVPCVAYAPVIVSIDEVQTTLLTCSTKPEEILKELGRTEDTYVVTSDKMTFFGREIAVTTVTKRRYVTWQKLSFPIDITYVKTLPHRRKVIDIRGQTGLRGIVNEEITYPGGRIVKHVVSKWIEREPMTEYQRVGTKYNMLEKVINGKTIHYWRTLSVVATSYDSSCYGCNDTTATGQKLRKGIVAVDPRVIPMHTQMYIPGYGFGKAEDTGGKIKGNRIDLGFEDLRYGNWSKRTVTIYIID